MSGSCWEALPDIQKWSGSPPGCAGVVGRASRPLQDIWEGLPTTPAHPGGPNDHSRDAVGPPDYSRTSRKACRPL